MILARRASIYMDPSLHVEGLPPEKYFYLLAVCPSHEGELYLFVYISWLSGEKMLKAAHISVLPMVLF